MAFGARDRMNALRSTSLAGAPATSMVPSPTRRSWRMVRTRERASSLAGAASVMHRSAGRRFLSAVIIARMRRAASGRSSVGVSASALK